MSLKIFFYQLAGKIKPVEKIETIRKKLRDDYDEFTEVHESEELKEFTELEKYILSNEFTERKKEIRQLRFKGSEEEKLLKEFQKLHKNRRIKEYFKVNDSQQLKRFEQIKNSDTLNEFRQLKEYVENGSYKREKEEMLRLVYKGSDEQKKEKEFNKLKKDSGIKTFYEVENSGEVENHESFSHSEKLKEYLSVKNLPAKNKEKRREFKSMSRDSEIRSYLKFEKSKKLKLYRSVSGSFKLKRYEELKAEIESDTFIKRKEFLEDRRKFEKTDAYNSMKRFKELAVSDDLKFFHKYEKSSQLQNFLKTTGSAELKRYNELNNLVNSEEFLTRKAWLEDDKKWEKSEEYSKEQKYLEMKARPHLVRYFKYSGTDAFNCFTEWEESFWDDFKSEKLDLDKWSVLPVQAEKTVGRNYSLPGDLHYFTGGENIRCKSKMIIETKKEQTNGLVWEMPAGFKPAEFDYTSGMAGTAKSFWQQDGIFEAKMKFEPVKQTVSSFVLQGEQKFPGVYLLEMGAKNRIGVSSKTNRGKLTIEGLDISNLKKGRWYIFTLEKTGGTLIWKINDTEVLKLANQNIDFPLHINLFTLVIKQIQENKLPVRFQTEWIKCYRKKPNEI